MRLWTLGLFAGLGLVSIVYGIQRADFFDIALGVVVLVVGGLAYLALKRRRD